MLRIAVARVPDAPAGSDDAAAAWMGDSERRRLVQLAPAARREFVASRALLRGLLRAATGVPEAAWDVSAEPGLAPFARTTAPSALHVSLSHRLGWVAAAVGDAPVGVDIECERPARSDVGERAALMLAPAELQDWQALPPEALERALLTRWTAKEAWFKASPPDAAPWDFRRIAARACARASQDANVRTWAAPPVHVALCCPDASALANVDCEGLASATTHDSFWHVHRAGFAT